MREKTIEMESNFLTSDELLGILTDDINNYCESDLFVLNKITRGSLPEPTVLVALVTAGSAAITALVVGIFKILEKRQEKIFEISIESGEDRIIIKGNKLLSKDELMALVDDSVSNLKEIKTIKIIEKMKI